MHARYKVSELTFGVPLSITEGPGCWGSCYVGSKVQGLYGLAAGLRLGGKPRCRMQLGLPGLPRYNVLLFHLQNPAPATPCIKTRRKTRFQGKRAARPQVALIFGMHGGRSPVEHETPQHRFCSSPVLGQSSASDCSIPRGFWN